MTPRQLRHYYFRAWGDCARALHWGRKPARLASWGPPEVNALYASIWNVAEVLAGEAMRDVGPDDLRHACHFVALDKMRSAKLLTNAEADRVVALFNLLAAPDDLKAMLALVNPAGGAAKRLIWSIEHAAPAAYVETISRDKFGTRAWRTLPEASLRQLALTLRNRTPADTDEPPGEAEDPF